MQETFLDTITRMAQTGKDIWLKDWAEANAGNISIRLVNDICKKEDSFSQNAEWVDLPVPFPDLDGEYFLVTGAGIHLRNIELSPEEALGVIELDETGRRYRLVWGYQKGAKPSSELLAHLQAQTVRKRISNDRDRVFIHCHCPNLIALSYTIQLDTAILTRLLWRMHIECIVAFPEGVEFIPWQLSGSADLARVTAQALEKRRAVVWQFHGIGAAGPGLDSAFGLIETIEKAAEIYLKTVAAGGINNEFTHEQMLALARAYNVQPDEEILKG
jgi:rhamnulose-1-phosphate aldolase